MNEFKYFENTDNKFLRLEKESFSNGYADKSNHPSLKSCLLRVPGSLNSKCLAKGLSKEDSRIKIIQNWDGKRVPISYELGTFHSYLLSESEKDEKRRTIYNQYPNSSNYSEIQWIEKPLQTPVEDNRHLSLWRILIPYLLNSRRMPESDEILILEKWLDGCNFKKKLTFRPLEKIKQLLDLLRISLL